MLWDSRLSSGLHTAVDPWAVARQQAQQAQVQQLVASRGFGSDFSSSSPRPAAGSGAAALFSAVPSGSRLALAGPAAGRSPFAPLLPPAASIFHPPSRFASAPRPARLCGLRSLPEAPNGVLAHGHVFIHSFTHQEVGLV